MTKRRPHFWIDEKLKRLEALVEEHKYTAAEMGRALGCTRAMLSLEWLRVES